MKKPDCKQCLHDRFVPQNPNYYEPRSIFADCDKCSRMEKYQESLEKNRLFTEGETITSMNVLLEQEWVLVSGRGKHIKAIRNMQLETVLRWLNNGFFKIAIRKEKIS